VRAIKTREPRFLTPVERADGIELLVQASRKPVLRDDWPDGFDYVCGHCKRMVIARCVVDGQIWDLAFQCYRCKGINLSPVLPPERALSRCVVPPPGSAEIVNGIDLKRLVLAGQAAVDRRQAAAGAKGATFGRPEPASPPQGDAKLLESVIEEVRQLLGPTFDSLERTDRRGRESKTPPKHRHPLMVMIQALRADISTFATGTPAVHIDYLMELRSVLLSLDRWQRHPFWPEMVHGLGNENEHLHTVILLAAATYFEDAGNNVEFKETGSDRTPDLFLVLGPRERIAVEVKAPNDLRGPSAALGYKKLREVVIVSMKKAGTGHSGQLSREHPAMLVIGSFRTWPSDVRDFEQAAADYLREATKKGKHKHVLTVGLLSLVTMIRRTATKTDSKAALQMTSVHNPGYEGDIKLIR
jgi:hypothetical protein